MPPRRHGRLELGPFLRELDARLGKLSEDELRALLRRHAADLEPNERESFLAMFAPPVRTARPKAGGDKLLADIDAFVAGAGTGVGDFEHRGRRRRNRWDDDDGMHAEWAVAMDALFARAGKAFARGDRTTALAAYRRLFDALASELFTEAFGQYESPESQLDTDTDEARARYLRCVLDEAPPEGRVIRLLEEFKGSDILPGWSVTLRAIVEADAVRPPWLGALLPEWIERLQNRKLLPGDGIGESPRIRLLREAVALHRGAEGLAELAAREGAEHGEIYADWVNALAESGDAAGAIRAARDGVRRVNDGWTRAGLADRLSCLADEAGDAKLALHGAREAWRGCATRRRLVRLCMAGAPTAAAREARLRAELAHKLPKDDRPNASLIALLQLLAGDVEEPLKSLARAKPLGWSGDDNVGAVVTPFLLVAATCPGGPPRKSVLSELWDQVNAVGRWDMADEPFDDDIDEGEADEESAVPEGEPALTSLLLEAITRHPPVALQRATFLDAAVRACRARADAIAGGKHRKAYGRAARALVGAAEALTLAGRRAEAVALVASVREAHRRKPAFCGELDASVTGSAIMRKVGRS